MGTMADRAATKFDGAMVKIDTSITATAGKVDTSAISMGVSLNDISVNARRAAAGIMSVGKAATSTGRAAAGMGAGAAAGGAGAGRSGGAHDLSAGDVAGLGGLAFMASGIHNAANLEAAGTQAAVAMGLPTDQVMKMFQPVAMQMSVATAQSTTDTMKMIQGITTSGFNNPNELLANNAALPMAIARYADTQFLGLHHVAFQDSVSQSAALAHQLGTRDPKSMYDMLNTLFKISQDMPDNIKTAQNQVKYYGAQYVQAGVTPSEVLQLQATADRLGLGTGRSGTGFRQILQSLRTPSSDKMFDAQSALGLISGSHMVRGASGKLERVTEDRFIKNGVFDVEGLFKYLNQKYDEARKKGGNALNDFNANLAGISTAGAAPIVTGFTSDAGRDQRAKVSQTMTRVHSLQDAQTQLINNLNNQTKLLTSNFATLSAVVAGPLIKPLTSIVHGMASGIGNAAVYLSQHHGAQVAATAAGSLLTLAGIGTAFKFLGGASMFGHLALHNAKTAAGIGAGISVPVGRGGAAGLARAGSGLLRGGNIIDGVIKGFFASFKFSELRGIGKTAALVGRDFGVLGRMIGQLGLGRFLATGGIGFFADAMAKLGLRAIPVVGELMLLWDAINFLGHHMKDISYMIGYAAAWIQDKGGPMMANAFYGLVNSGIKALTDPKVGQQMYDAFTALVVSLITGGGRYDKEGNFIQGGFDNGADAERNATKNPYLVGHYETNKDGTFKRDAKGHMIWDKPLKANGGGGFDAPPAPKPSGAKTPPRAQTVPKPKMRPKGNGRLGSLDTPQTSVIIQNMNIHPASDQHMQEILQEVHRQAKTGGIGTATHQSDIPAAGGRTAEVGLS
jgi:hypothetical protein